MERINRRELISLAGGSLAIALSGCSSITGKGVGTEEFENRLVNLEVLTDAEVAEADGNDVNVQVWTNNDVDGEGKPGFADAYVSMVRDGYELQDAQVKGQTGVFNFNVVLKRDWAQKYLDGEMTWCEFDKKMLQQVQENPECLDGPHIDEAADY